jgi:hypothetical protein
VSTGLEHYRTTFGDPALEPGAGSKYARIVAELRIERERAALTFFKLSAALYAAILLTLAAFFVLPETTNDLGARMGLLAAALFAAILNMSAAADAIGASTGLSLLDELHVVAFGLIVVATAIAIWSRQRLERGAEPTRIRRLNHLAFAVSLLVVVALNVGLVALAAG